MDPDEAPASPEISTSSAAATGEVGSSPSDCSYNHRQHIRHRDRWIPSIPAQVSSLRPAPDRAVETGCRKPRTILAIRYLYFKYRLSTMSDDPQRVTVENEFDGKAEIQTAREGEPNSGVRLGIWSGGPVT